MDGKRTLVRIALAGTLVGVELYLARDLTTNAPVRGYTATNSFSIAPSRAARIKDIAVTLGTHVDAGDVIARLETTELDNELAAADAERKIAAAAVVAQSARLRRDSVDLERRFASSSEQATADLATAEANARTAAAELAAIDAEVTDQTELVAKHLANASVLNSLKLRRAALAKQVEATSAVIGVLRGNANAASKRGGEVDDNADDQLAPLEARMQAADLRIAQLVRERERLTLRAPAAGVIDALPLHAGDLAAPQTPVAVLVAVDAQRVVACIPESGANDVEPGSEAEVTSAIDRAYATGAVESITGTIAPLPARCQPPNVKTQLMGRVAIVALDQPLGGIPGQTQLVKFSARRRPHDRTTVAPAPRPASPPADPSTAEPSVLVRSGEAARIRFEPSGLVWVPSLERYLIVSDDTKTAERHPVWLFTMSRDGVVDPRPVVVSGVDAITDLESITADDHNNIWVLASQSVNHKGERSAARSRLARLTFDKLGGLEVDKVIDFAGMLDRARPDVRAALGVTDTRALDIEAMTYHGGALYIGLKAPLDSDGRAQIWRVGSPERLLAGDLSGARLELWSKVKLMVEVGGRPTPAAPADMIFWDDATMVFGVTASGIDTKWQDGAIYVAKPVGGELVPHHVRTFPNLKPEGLARSPTGELVVVFDRGGSPAMWAQLPAALIKPGTRP